MLSPSWVDTFGFSAKGPKPLRQKQNHYDISWTLVDLGISSTLHRLIILSYLLVDNDPTDALVVLTSQAMNEAQRAEEHEIWLEGAYYLLEELLQDLTEQRPMDIDRQLLMLLAIEPPLLESVQQAINKLPPGSTQELYI